MNSQWENDWQYLPVIKALVAISALLHDWGKSTALFQSKLKKSNTKSGDPLRHEWISCLLLNALVQQAGNTDEGWLQLLANGEFDEQVLKQTVVSNKPNPLENLPPIAQLVGWLILTHHRLPYLHDPKQEAEQSRESLPRMLKSITAAWNYQNKNNDEKRLKACFEFPEGLLRQLRNCGNSAALERYSSLPHRQLRKPVYHRCRQPACSLPHRQLRNTETRLSRKSQRSLPHRQR